MRNWSSFPASNRTLPGDRPESMIDLVNQLPIQTPKGVSVMEILAIVGLVTAAFAAFSVAFGTDSRESFDEDPTRASTTLRYV